MLVNYMPQRPHYFLEFVSFTSEQLELLSLAKLPFLTFFIKVLDSVLVKEASINIIENISCPITISQSNFNAWYAIDVRQRHDF